jgi:hypothetical protein
VLFSAANNAVLVEGEGDRVARKVRSVWRSSQFAVQKFARPTVGKVSRRGVVVFSVMAGEGMTLTRIAVDRCVRFLSKCRFNRRLCSLGNELILLGQMHEKGRMKPVDLSQIFLSNGDRKQTTYAFVSWRARQSRSRYRYERPVPGGLRRLKTEPVSAGCNLQL